VSWLEPVPDHWFADPAAVVIARESLRLALVVSLQRLPARPRARARLDELEGAPEDLLEPTDQRARALLEGYLAAFERSDARLLERVLRTDATLEATPFRQWYSGRTRCIRMLGTYVLGAPGDWRMTATTANGQPAAAVYHRDAGGVLRSHGIVVLTATASGVSRVVEFHDPALVPAFGFPDRFPA
jgi:RNA polymerase sigma-70 factor (ECF subfamily)